MSLGKELVLKLQSSLSAVVLQEEARPPSLSGILSLSPSQDRENRLNS